MLDNLPKSGTQLQSTLEADGTLRLAIAETAVLRPGPQQVVVHIEAAPVNPSDLMTLLAAADPETAETKGDETLLRLDPGSVETRAGRIGLPMSAGLAGAGVVVAAGSGAERMLGRNVSTLSMTAGTFSEYVTVDASDCALLPQAVAPRQGADVFCNPMTALSIAATVRLEGHSALIHTAAASNLGRMLVGICAEDGIPLVNVVRREEQARMLAGLGATHIVDSSAPDFAERLLATVAETGATIAFDAIGGGTMPGLLLETMERAAASKMGFYSPYGSLGLKQVFVYGHLDRSPTILDNQRYGMVWDLRHWAMPQTLARLGSEGTEAMKQRVLSGLNGTFASHFTREISLAEALDPGTIRAYARLTTGAKFLINPSL